MQIFTVLLLSVSVYATQARNLHAVEDLAQPVLKRCITCQPFAPLCPPCQPDFVCSRIPQSCDACASAICVKADDAAATTEAGAVETSWSGSETATSSTQSIITGLPTLSSLPTYSSASSTAVSISSTSSQPASITAAASPSGTSSSGVATVTSSSGNRSKSLGSIAMLYPTLAVLAGTLLGYMS